MTGSQLFRAILHAPPGTGEILDLVELGCDAGLEHVVDGALTAKELALADPSGRNGRELWDRYEIIPAEDLLSAD